MQQVYEILDNLQEASYDLIESNKVGRGAGFTAQHYSAQEGSIIHGPSVTSCENVCSLIQEVEI